MSTPEITFSEWVNTSTQEICPECGASLQCLAGSSAHQNNWYCAKECGWQAWTSTKPPAHLHHAKPLARTNDGLTEEFRKDLENYLAETFCSILPNKE